MKNNKTRRLAKTECGAAAAFPAHQGRAPGRQKSPRTTRASCAALVNALFWKILVTRVKSFFVARPGAASPLFVSRAQCNEWIPRPSPQHLHYTSRGDGSYKGPRGNSGAVARLAIRRHAS